MTVQEVANRLVELARAGEWEKAQKELYHDKIVSIEPEGSDVATTHSKEEIFEKNKIWASMTVESHGCVVSDPIVADGYFSCSMRNDVTIKNLGRIVSTELCVYQVKDGKIVKEQFFHAPITGSSS